MKNLNLSLLLIAGIVAIMLFSFKNEEPIKEYAMMRAVPLGNNSIVVYLPTETKNLPFKTRSSDELDAEVTKVANDLYKEGWKIISTDCTLYPQGISYPIRTIHFERIKN